MHRTARRFLAVLLGVFGAAAFLVAGPAHAAPGCEYPASACDGPTLSLSTTVVTPGGTIGVTGTGFVPDKAVTLQLLRARDTAAAQGFAPARQYTLKTLRTGSDGSFSTSVTTPASAAAGTYDVLAVRATPAGFRDPSARLTLARGGDDDRTPDSNNETTTAFTGFSPWWLVLLAAALITIGVYVNRRGDRNPVRSIHG